MADSPVTGTAGRHGRDLLPSAAWEGCSEIELSQAWGLPQVHLHQTVDSTNDLARSLAMADAPAGTLVIADEQRSGRGRVGRPWISPPGVGLWCSFVLRDVPTESIGALPPRVALAVAGALDQWLESPVHIKWPNDLLIGERKVGGILCEGAWDGGRLQYVIVGIGLNLLQGADDFPSEIRSTATSLRLSASRPVSRFAVASAVVTRLRPLLFDGSARDRPLPTDQLAARDAILDADIEVLEPETGRSLLRGTARGIEADGALRVESAGRLTLVRTGTVRLRQG
jgi:BirA family transcriptional regulator, biotin operon repressor / biotin---[acetyl-CoA-carboxylase] ligase